MSNEIKPAVCVVGLGQIGLPTAAVIARAGCRVLGFDLSTGVVETTSRGRVHIEEVDLEGVVHGVVQRGMLRAATAIEPADVFVIAVPAPFARDGHRTPDVSYVLAVATEIAAVIKPGDLVILESTSPAGTTEQVRDLIAKLRPDLRLLGRCTSRPDLAIAYCPELVLPGRILHELTNNDPSIGGLTPALRAQGRDVCFYKRFVRGACRATDARSAEMTKLVENAYRDVNIAFANELSIISDTLGLDVWEVIRLANRQPRVDILAPGLGVGGHCSQPLVHRPFGPGTITAYPDCANGQRWQDPPRRRPRHRTGREPPRCGCRLSRPAIQGQHRRLPRKPGALVAPTLARRFGGRIHVVEPLADTLPIEFTGTGAQLIDLEAALESCAVLIVLVDHDAFRAVPPEERADKLIYDTRGIRPDLQPASSAAPLRLVASG